MSETAMQLSCKERLEFREQQVMHARGWTITDAPTVLPKHVTAWGDPSRLRGLSLVVTAEDARNHLRIVKTLGAANALGCATLLVTPNCYEPRAREAAVAAEQLHLIGAPGARFHSPIIDVVPCAKYRRGDQVWIVDTEAEGSARSMTVEEVDVADTVVYALNGVKRIPNVPQSDVFATALAASADAARFDRVMARAILEGIPLNEANED